MAEDRRLPPLRRVDPLPRGPFDPFTPSALAQSPPSPWDSSFAKSTWQPPSDKMLTVSSPASSADSSWQESFSPEKSIAKPSELTQSEILSLIAPKEIKRKAPLQLCGQKRKSSVGHERDDQREKHRIAECNRRKNLSQLHRDLDGRLHDFFLIQAGWNPAKSLPQSKEHIVQAAIFLLDFMHLIILHLTQQNNEALEQLPDKLQPQIRCMQFQQLISSLQQQNQSTQQELQAVKQEKQALEDRNRFLEFQLRSYEHIFRTPKSEDTSPQPLSAIPETKPTENSLPSLRSLCENVEAISPKSTRRDSWFAGPPQPLGQSFIATTPPMSGPPSLTSSFSLPA